MTKPRVQSPLTFGATEAAARLADTLGGATASWSDWLKTDRRPERAHRIPVEPGPGRPRYEKARIEAFIEEVQTARSFVVDWIAETEGDMLPPALLRLAVMADDNVLREELAAAIEVSNPMDFVAFEVLAGADQHGTPTIWLRNGLRGGMHYIITLALDAAAMVALARSAG